MIKRTKYDNGKRRWRKFSSVTNNKFNFKRVSFKQRECGRTRHKDEMFLIKIYLWSFISFKLQKTPSSNSTIARGEKATAKMERFLVSCRLNTVSIRREQMTINLLVKGELDSLYCIVLRTAVLFQHTFYLHIYSWGCILEIYYILNHFLKLITFY